MRFKQALCLIGGVTVAVLLVGMHFGQAQNRAPDGVAPEEGIFVTPVSGQPFSAVAVIEMTRALQDGSVLHLHTTALLARDSRGHIHNEMRQLVPMGSAREPSLLRLHIYDPQTRLNTYLNPLTHVATQRTLEREPSTAPPANWAQQNKYQPSSNVQMEDLGTSTKDGVYVHGYRRAITLDAKVSGTGRSVVVTDEYWYAEDIRLNLLEKHSDPRKGDFTTTLTKLNREEPSNDLFIVPTEYKVVNLAPER